VWTQAPRVDSFVNQYPTTEGGTHVSGLHAGIGRAMRRAMSALESPKRRGRLAPAVTRRGLLAALSIVHPKRRFEQTRTRLLDAEAFRAVRAVVADETTPLFWRGRGLQWFLERSALR
jgi:DNA gyrase/topoisomerase IV subunit B